MILLCSYASPTDAFADLADAAEIIGNDLCSGNDMAERLSPFKTQNINDSKN